MSVNFVLLANSTSRNKMLDKGGQARPPEVAFEDRLGVEDSHVAQKGRSMDQMEEGRVGRGRDIQSLAEIEVAIVK